MRDAPPSAAERYATIGVRVATAGGVAMVVGAFFDWPASALVLAGGAAFMGILTLELTRRVWDP